MLALLTPSRWGQVGVVLVRQIHKDQLEATQYLTQPPLLVAAVAVLAQIVGAQNDGTNGGSGGGGGTVGYGYY
jgi:hypothetical protein